MRGTEKQKAFAEKLIAKMNEEFDSRIRALVDSVTAEAWEAAFNEPCPTRERSWFLLNL